MCLRGHPGKTGIGKCTLVVAANSESVATEGESPPLPELRVAERAPPKCKACGEFVK